MNNRTLLKLAIPNIIANLTVPLAGLVDTALLGHLDDPIPLAGVALASLIFDYLFLTLNFLRTSTTGLTAQAAGAEDLETSAAVLLRALGSGLILGCCLLLLKAWIALAAFGALDGEQAVEQAGMAYYSARIWSAPANLGGMAILGWLLGHGRVGATLFLSALLNSINIVLSYIFIYKYGWAAAGAGRATMIAEWITFLTGLVLVRFYWGKHPIPRWSLVMERKALWETIKLQSNLLVRTFFLISTFSVFTNISAIIGTVTLAANSILLRLLSTCSYFIDGFAFSLETLAGRYSGADNPAHMRKALNYCLLWNIALVALCIVAFYTVGESLIGLITDQPPVIAEALRFLPWVSGLLVFSGFSYIFDGYFLGLSRGKLLRNAMMFSAIFGFAPFAVAAVHWQNPVILWGGLTFFMLVRALSLGMVAYRDQK